MQFSAFKTRLARALDLNAAFSRWVLGDEIISHDLKLAPEAYDSDGRALLSAMGFSRRDIDAAESALDGSAGSVIETELVAAGFTPVPSLEDRIAFARACQEALGGPVLLSIGADNLAHLQSALDSGIGVRLEGTRAPVTEGVRERISHALSLAMEPTAEVEPEQMPPPADNPRSCHRPQTLTRSPQGLYPKGHSRRAQSLSAHWRV